MASVNKDLWVKFGLGILAIVLLAFVTYYFAELTIALMAAVVIVLVLDFPLTWLERQGLSKGVSLLFVVSIGLVCLGLIGALISMMFVSQYDQIVDQIPTIIEKIKEQRAQMEGLAPQLNLKERLNDETIQNFQGFLFNYLKRGLSLFSTLFFKIGLLAALITAIMLVTRGTIKQAVVSLIPNAYFEVSINSINAVINTLRDYIFAKFLQTITIAIICVIGFLWIGLPGALILGVLAGLLNLIPYFGALISITMPLLIGLVRNDIYLAIGGVIVIIIAQAIDNLVLQPILIAKIVDVHPLLVVIVTFVGAKLIGPFGMIIAIPAYVILRITLTQFYELLVAIQKRKELFIEG